MRQKEKSVSFRLILSVPMSENSDGKENCYTKVGSGCYESWMQPFSAVVCVKGLR